MQKLKFTINILACAISLTFTMHSFSQSKLINLWGHSIPNSKETDEKEVVDTTGIIRIYKVNTPTIEVFLPSKNNAIGMGVVICPGGGYHHLSYDWEGSDVAKWFNSKGIAAFVLKYRLPQSDAVVTSYEAPLQDAQRAIRWVRFHADKFYLKPNKIGVMGFSAGGHLASTLGVQFNMPNHFNEEPLDKISAKPDFMILCYPVVTMKDDYMHKGSQNNLLGKNADDSLKIKYSNELHVTKEVSPTFIVHSGNDKSVPVENSLQLYKALNDNGVKTEMHIYPKGGHGYGLALNEGELKSWVDRLYDWLQTL